MSMKPVSCASDAVPRLTPSHCGALWAVLWRMLLLTPLLWVLGLVLLASVIAAFVAPPVCAACAFVSGERVFALEILVPWILLLSFGRPVLRWTLQGIEYAS